MNRFACYVMAILIGALSAGASAQVYRWDTGEIIPGTEELSAESHLSVAFLISETRNLRYADFRGRDLSGGAIVATWLHQADFPDANLTGASLASSRLTGASFANATV